MTDFGKDTSCTSELRTGRYVSGPRLVAESFYRRLTTPRGTLRGGEAEQNFGEDLSGLIGSVRAKAEAAALPGRIKSELSKDERAERVDVNVVDTSEAGRVSFQITIDAETSEGPFTLKLAASAVSVEILEIVA